jgi:hypothetical protein
MDQQKNELMSYCRQCGGERYHSVIAEETRPWSDDAIEGSDTWSMVECNGCHTVTFVHSHWFSEDYDITEDGPTPILHRDLYPPAPPRKMPEWGTDGLLCYSLNDSWIIQLHTDIYAAIGIKAYALAAMGMRAIVDFIVTSKAGTKGNFKEKLTRMHQENLITGTQVEVIDAAFDAGSAAAHRGHSPPLVDVYIMLEITESLLQQFYVDPARQRRLARDADTLKSKTPQRAKPKKDA